MPVPKDLTTEDVQTIHVARHRVVVEPTLHNRAQPLPELWDWYVPPMPKLRLQRLELGRKTFADCLALDDESAGLPGRPTEMGEPEEVERLRLALASPLPLVGCVTPELNQARLVRVELQPERPHAVLPFLEEPLRVCPMLESHDDVIG